MKLLNLFTIALLAITIGACGGAATEQQKTDYKKAETTLEIRLYQTKINYI